MLHSRGMVLCLRSLVLCLRSLVLCLRSVVLCLRSRTTRNALGLALQVQSQQFNVLVTTYEYVMRDRAKLCRLEWKYIIIDEAQVWGSGWLWVHLFGTSNAC